MQPEKGKGQAEAIATFRSSRHVMMSCAGGRTGKRTGQGAQSGRMASQQEILGAHVQDGKAMGSGKAMAFQPMCISHSMSVWQDGNATGSGKAMTF